MFRLRSIASFMLVCLLAVPVVHAADDTPGPAATVDAFHAALTADRPQAALRLLMQNVYIAEQGYVDTDRATYTRTQVKDDAAFAHATTYKVLNRHLIWLGDNAACVISQTRTTGSFDGHRIDLIGAETALLRKVGNGWQIDHLHWSAHPHRQPAAASGATQ